VIRTGCTEIEVVKVPMVGQHEEREFAADEFETNPPAGGDHNPMPLEAGQFYDEPVDLGQAVPSTRTRGRHRLDERTIC